MSCVCMVNSPRGTGQRGRVRSVQHPSGNSEISTALSKVFQKNLVAFAVVPTAPVRNAVPFPVKRHLQRTRPLCTQSHWSEGVRVIFPGLELTTDDDRGGARPPVFLMPHLHGSRTPLQLSERGAPAVAQTSPIPLPAIGPSGIRHCGSPRVRRSGGSR